eukprot:gene19210-29575_t
MAAPTNAKTLREEAKKCFGSGKVFEASRLYTEAIAELEATANADTGARNDVQEDIRVLYANRAECNLRMREWQDALTDSEASLRLKPWGKAAYRKAQALIGLEKYEEAYDALIETLLCSGVDHEAVEEKLLEIDEKAWKVKATEYPVLGRSLVATRGGFAPGDNVLSERPVLRWTKDESKYDAEVVEICAKHGVAAATGAVGVLSATESLTPFQVKCIADLSVPEIDITNESVVSWINAASELSVKKPGVCSDDPYAVSRLLLAIRTNAHHCVAKEASDPKTEQGGIFRLASKLAHSCAPNVVYQYRDNKVRFTALRHIAEGSLVTFSYRGELDFLIRSNHHRQRELYERFLFWCGCTRCQRVDRTRGIKCTVCCKGNRLWTGAYSSPSSDAPSTDQWRCDSCERAFADADLPLEDERRLEKAVSDLEGQSHVLAQNKYTLLKSALTDVIDLLGTEHWTFGASCKRLSTYFRALFAVNKSNSMPEELKDLHIYQTDDESSMTFEE